MTKDEMRQYAYDLILDHALDVEFLTIFEAAEGYNLSEPTEDEANEIMDLINRAVVKITWPEEGPGETDVR